MKAVTTAGCQTRWTLKVKHFLFVTYKTADMHRRHVKCPFTIYIYRQIHLNMWQHLWITSTLQKYTSSKVEIMLLLLKIRRKLDKRGKIKRLAQDFLNCLCPNSTANLWIICVTFVRLWKWTHNFMCWKNTQLLTVVYIRLIHT